MGFRSLPWLPSSHAFRLSIKPHLQMNLEQLLRQQRGQSRPTEDKEDEGQQSVIVRPHFARSFGSIRGRQQLQDGVLHTSEAAAKRKWSSQEQTRSQVESSFKRRSAGFT